MTTLETLTNEDLERVLVSILKTNLAGKNVCLALSGGIDSTLLTTLTHVHGIVSDLTAYTAKTHAGEDLRYAKMAAEKLGIRLKVVEIPVGQAALDLHWRLSLKAGSSLSLVGNSIGFATICDQARRDGFSVIVDGTGAEQVTGGNVRLAANYLQLAKVAGRQDLMSSFDRNKGNPTKINKQSSIANISSMREAIETDLEHPAFLKWHNHHKLTELATGIKIFMPFLDSALGQLKDQPLDFYYPDGWSKGQYRLILNRYVGEDLAYRIDNQGLRWPRKRALKGCKGVMLKSIRESGILNNASLVAKVQNRLGLMSVTATSRLYEQAISHTIKNNKPAV